MSAPGAPHRQATRLVGTGPIRLIVSHGWMGDHTLFDPFIPHIDQSRFTYAFLDSRGYGTRRGEAGAMTVEAMADDLVAVADGLGWDRFHVVGHSMGGMAAQRLMADCPQRLESAVLIAPVPACGARIDDARRSLLQRAIASPQVRRELIDVNTGNRLAADMMDRILDCSLRSTEAGAMAAYMESWAGPGFEAAVRGSKVPVLTVAGAFDPGASAERLQATVIACYPRSRLHQLPEAGHYPMLESPRELEAFMNSWCVHGSGSC